MALWTALSTAQGKDRDRGIPTRSREAQGAVDTTILSLPKSGFKYGSNFLFILGLTGLELTGAVTPVGFDTDGSEGGVRGGTATAGRGCCLPPRQGKRA